MRLLPLCLLACTFQAIVTCGASASSHQHRQDSSRAYHYNVTRNADSRPSAWCGWEMRRLVGSDPGPAFNLARNWASWGRAGAPGVGAVVVWPHHVGKIVGREGGVWVIESGNDGHAIRTRPRSIGGAIAFRWA
jgi:hypothetical protein